MKRFYLFGFLIFFWAKSQYINSYKKWYSSQEDKLPQNTIRSIVKDKYGFLWMSTDNGLVRFDGTSFKKYDISIPSVENRTILIDGSVADDWLFTFYKSGEIPTLITKRSACTVNDNSRKLFRDLPRYGFENLQRLLQNNMEHIKKDRFHFFISQKKFYLLDNYNLFYQDNGVKKYITKCENYLYYRFFLLNNKLFYIRDPNMVEQINPDGSRTFFNLPLKNDPENVSYFINNANQQVFIRSGEKIYLIEYSDKKIVANPIYENKDIRKLSLSSIYYEQKDRTLFLGTGTKGLLVTRKHFINVVSKSSNNVFNAIEKSGNNVITSRGELLDEKGLKTVLPFPKMSDRNAIITIENPEAYIFNRNEVLYHYYNKKLTPLLTLGKCYSDIYTISKGKDQRIWLSGYEKNRYKLGYIIVKEGKISNEKFYRVPISIKGIFDLGNNKLLLAAENGLYYFNSNTRVICCLIPKINFRSINGNADNVVWIESYGKGLYMYKAGKIYSPPKMNQHTLSYVHCVIDDNNGYYWLSSNNGLFQVRKTDMIDYYYRKVSNIYIQKYTLADGLLTMEFNGGNNINGLILANKIVFPSMDGLAFINIDEARPVLPSANFYIDKITLNNKEISAKDEISLERNFDNLRIFLDYTNYGNIKNDCIEYKIDNKNWQRLDETKSLYINSLYTGKHRIMFRKLKNFSSHYIYKTIILTVKPAYWETTTFRLFIILSFLAIVYSVYSARLKKITREKILLNKKIEQSTIELRKTVESLSATREELYAQLIRKKKFITTITHDITTPLKYIKMSSDFLLDSSVPWQEKEKIVQSIQDSISKITSFIESTLHYNKVFINNSFSKTEKVYLKKFMNKRSSFFNTIAEFKQLKIINKIDNKTVLNTNPDVLSIIVHNIIDNAVKYTHSGYLEISVSASVGRLTISFLDTGIGMTADEIAIINNPGRESDSKVGMRVIKELLPLINCKMQIYSKKNEGTRILLEFDAN
ncbi:signal transduction histidine kinase [Epilithonimonas hungarica]|uniref:ligand-binding sensor domain-containing protein n=1 Tax=Epilithonimonas hungarica TaxID=454006 RepID=UPI002781437C|nr:HAMP domain-containing sensor histidine kinase [Epilithonimonas hungarica]MDP9956032.1 signal transduction histidine kinase [Epilithonimonas hungarica]